MNQKIVFAFNTSDGDHEGIEIKISWSGEVKIEEIILITKDFYSFLKQQSIRRPYNTIFKFKNYIMCFPHKAIKDKLEIIRKWFQEKGIKEEQIR